MAWLKSLTTVGRLEPKDDVEDVVRSLTKLEPDTLRLVVESEATRMRGATLASGELAMRSPKTLER